MIFGMDKRRNGCNARAHYSHFKFIFNQSKYFYMVYVIVRLVTWAAGGGVAGEEKAIAVTGKIKVIRAITVPKSSSHLRVGAGSGLADVAGSM
jgi:hypothetical protein